MNFLSNLHTHTNFSDGESTMEEYIKKAINQGLVSLGFSDHTHFGEKYKQKSEFTSVLYPQHYTGYLNEFIKLKEKYKNKIELYISVEEDYLPYTEKPWLDYTMGAVHALVSPKNGMLYGVDSSIEDMEEIISHYNNVREFVKTYYRRYTQLMQEYAPDIGAHIDLITKFNGKDNFFSTDESWYLEITGRTLEKIKKTGTMLEVNTGGIARGYTKTPYPSRELLDQIKTLNIPITISSDAHSADGLDFYFKETIKLLKNHGFKSAKMLTKNKFIDVEL